MPNIGNVQIDIGKEIIGAAFRVHNTLGAGFLEKVYRNALKTELVHSNFNVEEEKCFPIHYKNQLVGEYFADLVVNDEFIIEVKAVYALQKIHTAQLLNYLKGSGMKKGLLINFSKSKVEFKRLIC